MIDRSPAVETTRVVRLSTAACIAGALLCVVAASAVGHARAGAVIALGAIVGAANAYVVQRLVSTGLPVAATSLVRITVMTAVALFVGLVLGIGPVWLLIAGIAAAQLVMAAAALLEMSRR